MDKRKINGSGAVGEDLDERAAKRRKAGGDDSHLNNPETAESTTQKGLELVNQLKKTADKNGRLIASNFLTLPSKRAVPDYYEVTEMPIAIDTIQQKLNRREFPNLTTLESYFKRMVQNAKDYNERGSEIFEDAERLRKALSNFMVRWNPAYKLQPGYASFPTPLPSQTKSASRTPQEPESQPATGRKTARNAKMVQTQRSSATPALSDRQVEGGFEGLTFQQAQEKIVLDVINEKEFEEDEFAAFEPFMDLLSKVDFKDYYDIIANPTSLKSLQKSVKGVIGKNGATGVSLFKTWAAFEEGASLIWKNAYQYNEDNSPIFLLAKDLEKFFKKTVAEARRVVPEPAVAKIKLKMPEKITLKFGGNKNSPADSPAPQAPPQPVPQINGANGANGRRNPFGNSNSAGTPLERTRSGSDSISSPTPSTSAPSAPVKNEDLARNSPAIQSAYNGYRGDSQGVPTPNLSTSIMAPPITPGLGNVYTPGGYTQSFGHHSQYPQTNPAFDSKLRQPGKNASDAMITNVSLATHPGLNITGHFRMDLPASDTLSQQSVTINLPSTHFHLQIKPQLSDLVLKRQYRLFVTNGTQRLLVLPIIPGHPVDDKNPLFEARLTPGVVNRIEIEIIAALPKGSPKPANGSDVEFEKITIFANSMK